MRLSILLLLLAIPSNARFRGQEKSSANDERRQLKKAKDKDGNVKTDGGDCMGKYSIETITGFFGLDPSIIDCGSANIRDDGDCVPWDAVKTYPGVKSCQTNAECKSLDSSFSCWFYAPGDTKCGTLEQLMAENDDASPLVFDPLCDNI